MSYRLYTHYLDVTRCSEYTRRSVRVPSWETFGNQTQFSCLRMFQQANGQMVDIQARLDQYTVRHHLGRVIWPHCFIYQAANLDELVAEIKRRDLFLFDIWGFVPCMLATQEVPFGHLTPTPEQLDLFHRELGDHFLGIDNGEQDGRYISSYSSQMCPAPLDHFAQFMNFHRHFRRMGDDLGNHLSALISLTASHHFLKEGNTVLVGAETAQALPNSQVYYSFLRGAGKQYGVHWFGNASVFNRWGWKSYQAQRDAADGNTDHTFGPDQGTSVALLKRLLWTHIVYNSVHAGFEASWFCGEEPDAALSPIGEVQQDAQHVLWQRGRAGVHIAPLALMLDFYAGWVPARHLYSRKAYQTWGGLPYGPGDYLTHRVFNLIYPGYEDASYYRDERGFLTPTPYGDIADVVLSDAQPWMLGQYATVLVAGRLDHNLAEVADNLRRYAEAGGRVILTGANAARLGVELTGVNVAAQSLRFPAGTLVSVGAREVAEPYSFDLLPCTPEPGVQVLAECAGHPAALAHALGQGQVITLLSPYGINAERLVQGPIRIEEEKPLPQPYLLCQHVTQLLDQLLAPLALFQVGDNLGYAAARKAAGQYELLIYNNTLSAQPFSVRSVLGPVQAIREVSLGQDLRQAPGYKPGGYQGTDLGEDTPTQIAGLGVRLFEVVLTEQELEELPSVIPPARVRGRGLTLTGPERLEQAILRRPTFPDHYDTVVTSWRYFHERDQEALADEGAWLQRQGLRLIVNLADGLNLYPDLTLVNNVPEQWQRSRAIIARVLEKMGAAGARDAILTLTRSTEGASWSRQQAKDSFLCNMRALCDLAVAHGITLHLQNHPQRFYPTADEMLAFIAEVDRPNLRYALHAGHLLALRDSRRCDDLVAALEQAGERCELVLLSAPFVDESELVYDAHAPVCDSPCEQALAALADSARDKTLILDVLYPDQDAEFRDRRVLWG